MPSDECLLRFAWLRLRPAALVEPIEHDPRGSGACHLLVELSAAFQETICVLADWRYPVRPLWQAVETRLRRSSLMPGGHAPANVWTCYRNHWAAHNRGRLLTKALRRADVIRDIERYAADAACLTRHSHFVRLFRCDLDHRTPASCTTCLDPGSTVRRGSSAPDTRYDFLRLTGQISRSRLQMNVEGHEDF